MKEKTRDMALPLITHPVEMCNQVEQRQHRHQSLVDFVIDAIGFLGTDFAEPSYLAV